MKILRLFAIILILMNSAMLLADDTGFVVKLNVVEDKILAGDHFNVDVEITNPENFYGFDLFINLKPLGLDEAFEFVSFTPADDRFDGHTSGSPPPVNNILRIFAAHEGETTAFLGNEGAIGTIQLKAPELPGGPHLLQIDEVQSVLSDIDGLPIQYTVDPSQAEVILVGNEMTILDAEVIIGQDVTIYVEIDNYQDFTAFQADIILPDDFEYIAGTAMLSDRAVAGDHQLDVSEYIKDGNTILRLFAASADNTLFGGNGGVVVQFGLTCDIDAEDESYPLDFEASIISDVLGANILTEQNAGEITVFSNNTIIVVDAEGLTNETITMELDIDNSLPFVGFEVEIVFPEGFTFYPESLELTDRAAADHNLEVSALPGVDNAYKVFVFSPSNSEFSLFEGAVATFHVKLPNDPGTYDVEILNGIIANEQGQEIESDKVDGLVTVQTIIELALQDTDACSNFPVTVDLNLLNSQVLLGFETRVQIPDGFSYVAGSAVVNPARVEEHLVDAQFNEVTGVLTVIVFSNNPDANEIAYTNESSWIVQFDLDAPDVQESTIFDIELFGSLAASATIEAVEPDEIDAQITLHPEPFIGFTFGEYGLAGEGDTFTYCFEEPVSVTLSHIWNGTAPFDIEWTVTTENGAFEGDTFAHGVELGGLVFGGIEAPGTYVIQVTSIVDANGCSPVDLSPYTATVIIYEDITYTAPEDLTVDACVLLTQDAVDAAINDWIDSALDDLTGGENVSFTHDWDGTIPALCEGGLVEVTWTITDRCGDFTETAVFELIAPQPLLIEGPDDIELDACDIADQDELNAAFAIWLGGFSVSGGCDAELPDLSIYQAPDLCEGGEVSITLNVEDIDDHICYAETPPVSATFKVNAVPELIVVAPESEEHDACDFADQNEVNAAFATWIGGFSVTGGCDAEMPDLSEYVAPGLCEGGEVFITFDISDVDDHTCYAEMPPVSATFKLNAVPELIVAAPESEEHDACDFADQDEVNAAFATWIGGFSVTGGCDAELPDLSMYEAPGLCEGGEVFITFDISDVDDHTCYAEMPPVSATFKLNAVPELIVIAPESEEHDACDFADQDEVNAAFATWIGGFSVTGGCDAELPDLSMYEAPGLCEGGEVFITFTVDEVDDHICYADTPPVSATFKLNAPDPITYNAPVDADLDGNDFASQEEIDAAFAAWLADQNAALNLADGCDPVVIDDSELAIMPDICEGGTAVVTWVITDLCETVTLTASFNVSQPDEPLLVFAINGQQIAQDHIENVVYGDDVEVIFYEAWAGQYPFTISWTINGETDHMFAGNDVEITEEGQLLFPEEGTVIAAGTYVIEITSIVDANGCEPANLDLYKATIVVAPLPITITAIGDSKVYGEEDPLVFEYTADELTYDDVFTGELVREEGEDVGVYEIQIGTLTIVDGEGNNVADNYDITFVPADFEITPATLTVIADEGLTKVYGEDDPVFTYTVTGFAFDEDETILTGELSREEGEDVGMYAITIGTLSAGDNYVIDFTSADFEITPATLTVVADEGLTKVYGEDDPVFTYTVTGFVYDDDETILTGELSREEGEDVGIYAITLGTLSAGDNYVIDFTSADFEILPKELFIVGGFTALDKVYDGNVIAEIDIDNLSLAGLIEGDDVTIVDLELEFEDANVGEDKLVSIVNADIAGADAGNYVFNFPADKALTGGSNAINPADFGDDNVILIHAIEAIAGQVVTVEIEIVNSEEFVGFNLDIPLPEGFAVAEGTDQLHRNTNHNLMFNVTEEDGVNVIKLIAFSITNDAFLGNDGVIVTFELMTAPEAGDFTLEIVGAVLGNADAEDILDDTVDGTVVLEPLVGLPTTTADIFHKELVIGGDFTALDKVYDGTVDAEIDVDNLELVGVVGDEDVALTNVVVEFADANAGTDILVTIVSAEIEGADIDNYTFTIEGAPVATADILPAALTVIADEGLNKVYGETDPVFTYTVSGFIPGEDDSLITGELSREPGEDVGTYAITLGTLSAGDNYEIVFTSADFEITPATLVVVADGGLTKVYGEDDPEFTYTATGFQFDEGLEILTGELEREPGEDVGTYAILIGSLDAGDNYVIDFTGADFEITAATLMVVANDDSKVYGEDDPVFTFVATGFQFDDDETIFTGALDREPGEDVGTYAILIGSLSAGDNYVIDFTGADFVITVKQIFITGTFTAFDKEYDSTTDAEIDDFDLVLDGVVGDDDVQLTNVVVEFEDPNVGEDILVSIVHAEITGDDIHNYHLVTGLMKDNLARTDENVMMIHDITAQPGDIITVEIEVLNYEEFVGFSVDVPLPDGFTYIAESVQLYRKTNHDVVFNVIEATNLAKMIAFSITNDAFLGNDGVILSFDLQTPSEAGSWTLELVDAVVGNAEAQDILDASVNGTVVLEAPDAPSNIMFINNVMATPGSIFTVEIEVENEEEFAGFSVDVALPEGFDYVEGSTQLFRGTNHDFVFNVIEGNIAKIIAFSITNDSFVGNEGLLFSFDVQTPEDAEGEFVLELIDPVLGNAEAQDILTGFFNGTLFLGDIVELPTAFANIYPKELTIGGSFTAFDKLYDGTVDAEIDEYNLELIGVIGDEDVELDNVVVEFAQADVGNDILVSIVDAEIVGDGISNYALTLEGAPTTTADIWATLTLIAEPEEGGAVTGAGVYNFGEMVDVDAIPNEGWAFVNWTDLDGNIVSDEAFNTIEITGDLTLIANFEMIDYTLTLIANPEDGGVVTGAGVYNFGDEVDVDAIPNEGWAFINWTDVDGNVVSDQPANTIPMPAADLTLTANFEMIDYTLTLIANPEEGGEVTGAGVYNFGDEVDVDAIPNEGWAFVEWTLEDGTFVSDSPDNLITMPSDDLTLVAHFEMIDYTLTLIANPAEGGEVTGAGVYNFGDEVPVDAIPNEGWAFVEWTLEDGTFVSDSPDNLITMPSDDLTLVAHFEMIDYTLTLIANPEDGGEVTGAGVYNFGDEVDVDAIPNEGWAFVEWTLEDGTFVSDSPDNLITMPSDDLTLVAHFEMIDYTLTLIANPEEGGTVTGAGVYNFGDMVDVDAIPNAAWIFVNWTDVDGNVVSDQPANTIPMPAADHTLIANFELNEFEVTFHVLEDSADEAPIAGAIIHIDGVDEVLITDDNGMASIMLIVGDYTADVTAEHYEDVMNVAFSVVDQAIDVTVHMLDVIVTPFNLAVYTEGFDFGEALFTWNDGLHQFRKDDGSVAGQLGFVGTLNSVLGTAYHYDAEVKEVVWWLTSEEGEHATVKVWILGLDEFGNPDKNNILYTNNAVPNVDNMWNRYELATPVHAPNGFFVGFSYEGYLSLAVDSGTSNAWPFNEGTQFTILDITADEEFIPLENDGFEVNFLARAYGYNYGAVDYNKADNYASSVNAPVFIPEANPFDAGDILADNYAKTFVGFDVFLNGNEVASGIHATDYIFKDLTVGQHTAGVRSVYTTGMSEIVTINFEVPDRTFRVTFNVVDTDGEQLQNAIVTLDGVTNDAGDYSFDGILAGTYDYVVEKAGYFTVDGSVTVTDASITVTVEMIVDDTAVVDPDVVNLSLYPNPASSILTIEANTQITGVRMVDMLGRLVYDVVVNDDRHEVDVNNFDNGIYFVQITTPNGVFTHRVQVAH